MTLESLLKREQWLVLTGLTLMIAVSWLHLSGMSPHAMEMNTLTAPVSHPWGLSDALTAFLMWTIMMIGMMLPSAAPWALTVAGLTRRDGRSGWFTATGGFVIGYLAVWTGYSVGAAGLQWALHDYGLLSTGDTIPAAAGGGALMLAGLYQWSAVKYACLRHCRSPLGFFLSSWRDGGPGALRMGFQHGLYCVGCCWALMGLSFVAGLMNLLWMAAVTVFVFVDHIFPSGLWLSRLAGAGLIVRGLWMIAESGLFF